MRDSSLKDQWLQDRLRAISDASVTVFGDFCVDAYWIIDSGQEEKSMETLRVVRRVRRQRYSLGGAGNIVANLVDLGVRQVRVVGLIGNDLFGQHMLQMLASSSAVDCRGMLSCQSDWQTLVYAKPHINNVEQDRIDFGAFNVISPPTIEALGEALNEAATLSDVIILNQQVPWGVSTPAMIERLNEVVSSHPAKTFIVDSRHRAQMYRGVCLKLNAHEACRLLGRPVSLEERIPAARARQAAMELASRAAKPVFLTRGENGILVAEGLVLHEISGIQIVTRTDPVGAGDTVLSAIAAVLASGGSLLEAATLANIAASITVRKLRSTGTASPEEIGDVGAFPDYVYSPELADDSRQACYRPGTEIEIVRDQPAKTAIRHAIFDHDGTISTLRQGWEAVMEPMMVRSILGDQYDRADESLYHRVVDTVRQYIDKTTGLQTLMQMQGLVELVRQFGCVPEQQVLDMAGYKDLYNHELLAMVRLRMEKLSRGELDPGDFCIKGSVEMLTGLHARGVRLHLASGTDLGDVKAEAVVLGYAPLFEGRIFGAVGDVKVEAKKVVLESIFREHRLSGPEVVTFGDGPVEMRQTRKHNGIAVGVASDEVRRFGLNSAKRSRLIRAGADMVIPDFSQHDKILAALGLGACPGKSRSQTRGG